MFFGHVEAKCPKAEVSGGRPLSSFEAGVQDVF
jgi:hypothetical protein